MSNLRASEVEAALETKYETEYNGDYFWSELEYTANREAIILEVDDVEYELSVVESDTGGEGHGEYCSVIIKVGDQLFRKEGYYASHHGTDWDGRFVEVASYQETVTKFRSI